MKITKEIIREAFQNNKKMRNQMLYDYYRDEYFTNNPYTAELVAKMISQDLQIPISTNIIHKIHHRIIRKLPPTPLQQTIKNPSGNKEAQTGNVPKERPKFNFRNADDIPEERDKLKKQLDKAFEGL